MLPRRILITAMLFLNCWIASIRTVGFWGCYGIHAASTSSLLCLNLDQLKRKKCKSVQPAGRETRWVLSVYSRKARNGTSHVEGGYGTLGDN